MMTLSEIIAILIFHWIADFIFQDEKWALGKSKNWSDLLTHTFVYSIFWYFLVFPLNLPNDIKIIQFVGITFVFHTLTDYFTSRVVSKKFENKHFGSPVPNFGAFTIIGFDQLLHYTQLFATYWYLFKT